MSAAAAPHDCPLCGHHFAGDAGCPSGCPMAKGCGMVKCPNCRYEWVERSRTVDAVKGLLGRWFGRPPTPPGSGSQEVSK